MILTLLEAAGQAGARRAAACRVLGLSVRTVERWQRGAMEDRRHGPHHQPAHALSACEQQAVLAVLNSPAYRDCSPHQIVPRLADAGEYLASEATMFRLLRAHRQLTHRGRAKRPVRRPPRAHVATGPNQVWSWDITYLRTPVRGTYTYLYLVLDIWSRKIVGWAIHDDESATHAAQLVIATCQAAHLDPRGIVLHADNGSPMKGATMLATLERLGVVASFSRPSVSNDNAYSEALFRTLKYRPAFPRGPFATRTDAITWMTAFVQWYNTHHQHSALRFVTPAARHAGTDHAQLAARRALYARARNRTPTRWRGATRNWDPVSTVYLNPDRAAVPQGT